MPRDGRLHRLDPRVKLLAAVAFVVFIVSIPPGSWQLLGASAGVVAVLAAVAGVSPVRFLTRWLSFAIVVLFLSALTATRLDRPGGLTQGQLVVDLVVRNSLAFLMMMILAHVTPWPRLLGALRRLGVPAVLATTLALMYRYLFVLGEELRRMTVARRARSFRRTGLGFGTLAGLIGALFFRAMEREERVFAAMTARGWDGTWRTLDD